MRGCSGFFLLAVLSAFLSSECALARSVTGTVRDGRNDLPVAGAVVTLGVVTPLLGFNTTATRTTGADGRFEFLDLSFSSTSADLKIVPPAPLLPLWYPSASYRRTSTPGFPFPTNNINFNTASDVRADVRVQLPGSLEGVVLRESDATPIAAATVRVIATGGVPEGTVTLMTDANGRFRAEGLAPVLHHVSATATGFTGEFFPDVPCQNCETSGSSVGPVRVQPDQLVGPIEFRLSAGAVISGRVSDAQFGALLRSVDLTLYDAAQFAQVATTMLEPPNNTFTFRGLPAGRYVVSASNQQGAYISQVFSGRNCAASGCTSSELAAATPIELAIGSVFSRADFALTPRGSISGCVRDAASGAPLSGIDVVSSFVVRITGILSVREVGRSRTSADGCYQLAQLGPLGQVVRTVNTRSLTDLVYPAVVCNGADCNLEGGVRLSPDPPINGIDFSLAAGSGLRGRFIAYPGAPDLPAGTRAEILTAAGRQIRPWDGSGFRTGAGGSFETYALAAGDYCLSFVVSDGSYQGAYRYTSDTSQPVRAVSNEYNTACEPVSIGSQGVAIDFRLDPRIVFRSGFD